MRTKIVATVGVVTTVLLLTVLSYAYFSIDTSDNKNQEAVIETGTMRLKFVDNDTGFNGKLNFGESAEKLFIIENTGTLPAKAKINFVDMINTYAKGSLTYKLEYKTTEDGTTWIEVQGKKNVARSSEAVDKLLAGNLEIPVGAKYYYRLTVTLEDLEDTDQTEDINATFSTKFNLEDATKFNVGWLQQAVIDVSNGEVPEGINTAAVNFANPATTDEGIFSLEDDYGTSYYFRGASKNNYIKYGKNKDGQDMYWRIIRINGNGSLRIMYDGTQAFENGVINDSRFALNNSDLWWNKINNDAKYVGYMFGGAQGEASTSKEQAQRNETNSDAKTAVDTWYRENIADTVYEENIVDAVFCNDRSISSGPGYGGQYRTEYSGFVRVGAVTSASPKFTCDVKNDSFTVNESEKGNGDLTYPVGLITVDEILTAGSGKYGLTENKAYYLYKSGNRVVISMTPLRFFSGGAAYFAAMGAIRYSGGVTDWYSFCVGIAPVINLSAEYASELIGDGTMTNPYRENGVTP